MGMPILVHRGARVRIGTRYVNGAKAGVFAQRLPSREQPVQVLQSDYIPNLRHAIFTNSKAELIDTDGYT